MNYRAERETTCTVLCTVRVAWPPTRLACCIVDVGAVPAGSGVAANSDPAIGVATWFADGIKVLNGVPI